MKDSDHKTVYGHRLRAPRLTLWAPFLLAATLSGPVALVSVILTLL